MSAMRATIRHAKEWPNHVIVSEDLGVLSNSHLRQIRLAISRNLIKYKIVRWPQNGSEISEDDQQQIEDRSYEATLPNN